VEGKGDNLAKRFKESGAKLACLCSDKVYKSEAEDVAKALAQAGATRIYLAGKPGADKSALEKAGVSTFLHQGCDTLETLTSAYDEIDV
jgi:methylmalonyl-CoA mutase